jgi:hypothetical protein
MNTLGDFEEFEPGFPLSETGFAVECYETVWHLGLIPFYPSAEFTHSLWLIFESRWGGRGTRAYCRETPWPTWPEWADISGAAGRCRVG